MEWGKTSVGKMSFGEMSGGTVSGGNIVEGTVSVGNDVAPFLHRTRSTSWGRS